MTITATKLRQFNLYVEMSYEVTNDFILPEWYDEDEETTKEWSYRLENNLPGYNLHFLTTCEDVEEALKEASINCPQIKDFLEEHKDNIADICFEDKFDPEEAAEYGCPELDNDMTDYCIGDNWCGNV